MMRIALKLALPVLAAIAVSAPSASATDPITMMYDPEPTLCTTSECTLHFEGEQTSRTHFFGVEANEAECHVELEATTDEDGYGEVTAVTSDNGAHGETNCPTVAPPCSGDLPWSTSTEALDSDTVEVAVASVCVDPSEFLTCEGALDVQITEDDDGDQTLDVVDNRIGSSFCEVDLDAEPEVAQQQRPRFRGTSVFTLGPPSTVYEGVLWAEKKSGTTFSIGSNNCGITAKPSLDYGRTGAFINTFTEVTLTSCAAIEPQNVGTWTGTVNYATRTMTWTDVHLRIVVNGTNCFYKGSIIGNVVNAVPAPGTPTWMEVTFSGSEDFLLRQTDAPNCQVVQLGIGGTLEVGTNETPSRKVVLTLTPATN